MTGQRGGGAEDASPVCHRAVTPCIFVFKRARGAGEIFKGRMTRSLRLAKEEHGGKVGEGCEAWGGWRDSSAPAIDWLFLIG